MMILHGEILTGLSLVKFYCEYFGVSQLKIIAQIELEQYVNTFNKPSSIHPSHSYKQDSYFPASSSMAA